MRVQDPEPGPRIRRRPSVDAGHGSSASEWGRAANSPEPNRPPARPMGVDIFRGTDKSERQRLGRRCAAGELHRIHGNTYVDMREWLDLTDGEKRRLRHLTAVDTREGMVLVGRSAALAHGLDVFDDGPRITYDDVIELAHPSRRRFATRAGVRESRLWWKPADITRIDGRPVASVGAAIADIEARHGFTHALVAADSALRSGHAPVDLVRVAERSRNPRRVLRVLACATPFSGSAAESIMRARMIEGGLPAPQPQTWVFDARGILIGQVDLLVAGLLVAIEIHGQAKFTGAYGDPGARFAHEWRRESELMATGLLVVRVSWPELMSGEAVRRVREAVDSQRVAIGRGARFEGTFVRAGQRWPDGLMTRRQARDRA